MSEIPIYKFAVREDLKNSDISFMPVRATEKAAGWDVKCAAGDKDNPLIINAGEYVKIPLGIRAFCPEGYWLELKPRSSTFAKKYLNCLYGTIDQDFSGSIMFACQYIPPTKYRMEGWDYTIDYNISEDLILVIPFGEPIGQLIPVKMQEMLTQEISNQEFDDLCKQRNSNRNPLGFGTTGNK